MANVISLPYSTSSGTYGSTLSNTYEWYVQWYQYPTITDTMKSSDAYMKINSFTNNADSTVVANITIYSQNAITRTGTSGYTCTTFTFKSQPTILLYNKTLGTSISIYNAALTTTVADNGTGAVVSSSITHSSTINVNIPESWFEEENRYWYFTISDVLTIVDTSSTLTNTKTFETFVVDALYDVFVRKDVKLPDGYTMLSYIESTGTQYLNTGFKHNQNTRIVMDVQPTSITADAWLFGAREKSDGNRHDVFYHFSGTKLWTSDYSTASHSRMTFGNIGLMDRLNVDYNKNICKINGVVVTHTTTTFQCTNNLYLLAFNTGNPYGILSAKLYSCQIYDNGTLIRDYIPCLNTSNIAGLYDLVNGVFYGDSAGGTFIASPISYTPVEYIQTDTSSYFDTNFKPNQDTRVIMDVESTSTHTSGTTTYYGVRANSIYYAVMDANGSNYNLYYEYGTKYSNIWEITSLDEFNQRRTIDTNKNNAIINDVIKTYDKELFQFAYSLYLMASNEAGIAHYNMSGKLYSCKIYDNDILVRDYIPVIDSNNVGCLYDKINKEFCYNKGTGTIICGLTNGSVQPSQINARLHKAVNVWVKKDGVLYPMKSVYSKVGG